MSLTYEPDSEPLHISPMGGCARVVAGAVVVAVLEQLDLIFFIVYKRR